MHAHKHTHAARPRIIYIPAECICAHGSRSCHTVHLPSCGENAFIRRAMSCTMLSSRWMQPQLGREAVRFCGRSTTCRRSTRLCGDADAAHVEQRKQKRSRSRAEHLRCFVSPAKVRKQGMPPPPRLGAARRAGDTPPRCAGVRRSIRVGVLGARAYAMEHELTLHRNYLHITYQLTDAGEGADAGSLAC